MPVNFIKKIYSHKTQNISLAAFILSVFSFLSFVLGLLRDRLLTGNFGIGNELDVYYAAFRIPDFIAMVLMTGAIGVAIIPIFTKNLVSDKNQAFKYLSNLLNLSLFFLIIICLFLFVFAPNLVSLIAPGFSADKKEITILLTRIMLLSPILMGISNIISAILRVFQRFLITALAPVVYNLGSIIGIIFFVPKMGISGLAFGIVLGAFLHLLIQMPAFFKIGFKIQNTFDFLDKDFLLTLKLTVPRAIGLAASQINLVVVTIIGSTLIPGSVGIFNLANDLSLPIIGLVAVPFTVAVFPALSLAFSKGDKKEMLLKFSSVFRQIVFLIVPISAISFLLRAHLVRVAFGAGRFDWSATKLTAACFGIFMFGLFAQGLIYLVSKAFYAIRNTRTPALVSILSVATTVVFSYFFIWLLGFENIFSNFLLATLKIEGMQNLAVIGLPFAISLDAILQLLILLFFFKKEIGDFHIKEIVSSLGKILLATFITIFFTYFIRQILSKYMTLETFWEVFLQTGVAGGLGMLFYLLVAFIFKSSEVMALKNLVSSQLGFLNGKNGKTK
ncbi:MAG: murein biosynthesis integral membrane protein MurJ [Candidatus Staskawiczbacteria bacterium]|nr:murein biosynthesis integral membrane protein MurJ [Candidatus Staskawiczbacteria bacterium]